MRFVKPINLSLLVFCRCKILPNKMNDKSVSSIPTITNNKITKSSAVMKK